MNGVKRGQRSAVLFFLVVLVAGVQASETAKKDVFKSGPATWRKILSDPQEQGLIPGALLVVKGPTWGKRVVSVGTSNMAEGAPISLQSPFRVGPLTQTMVAVALLQMETEWKVRFNQSLAELLGDGIAPGADQLTVRDCLLQASNLYDFHRLPACNPSGQNTMDSRIFTPEELVALAVQEHRKAPSAPGYFKPSATDHLLAGMIAEKVDRKPLEQILAERVFKRIGLKNTYFDTGREVPAGMVHGYTGGQGTPLGDRTYRHPSADWASGAVVSTPLEVLTFMEALFSSRRLLTQHANARMFKYISDWDGTPENARGMGVIERVSIRGSFRGIEGFIPGYYTCAGYYLHGETYILLFINTSDHNLLSQDLYNSLLRQISGATNRMQPKNGASIAGTAPTLSWSAGLLYGQEYHVYVGEREDQVESADNTSHPHVKMVTCDKRTYSLALEGLTPGKRYYWRVDTARIRPSHEMDNLRKKYHHLYQRDSGLHYPIVAEEEVVSGPVFSFTITE